MAPSEFLPDVDEQARRIIDILRDSEFDLPEEIGPEDIVDNIDPDKPTSVNLRAVRRGLDFSNGLDLDSDVQTQIPGDRASEREG